MAEVETNDSDKLSITIAFAILVVVIVGTGLIGMIQCYCGRENEYVQIRDVEFSQAGDVELARSPLSSSSKLTTVPTPVSSTAIAATHSSTKTETPRSKSASKKTFVMPRTTPTVTELSSTDNVVQEIDFYVRHMEDFHATGFYCSVVVLENQLKII